MKGRPPKSIELKLLHGNPGKQNLDDSRVPNPEAPASPRAPKWLSGEAKKVWKDVIRKLSAARILTGLDLFTIARYADLSAGYIELCSLVELFRGKPEYASIYNAKQKLHKELLAVEKSFGMTPDSRERVRTVTPPDEKDEWANY